VYTHIFKALGFGFFALGFTFFSVSEIRQFISKHKRINVKPLVEPKTETAEDLRKYIL
jgi:hypothetical protein